MGSGSWWSLGNVMPGRYLFIWDLSHAGGITLLNSFGSASENVFAMCHLAWYGGAPVNTAPEFQAWILPGLHPDAWSHFPTGGNGNSVSPIPQKAGMSIEKHPGEVVF